MNQKEIQKQIEKKFALLRHYEKLLNNDESLTKAAKIKIERKITDLSRGIDTLINAIAEGG